ncbi:MAG TPA: prolyl oligopeptidase family serine peptidase [Actinomycetota bacterium]|nr:prolyl oligopeptidase family serine peptidase [Actinomycetota bacterium]
MKKLMVLIVVLASAIAVAPARAESVCTDDIDAAMPFDVFGVTGHVSKPAAEPTTLVVFGHGYRNRSDSWIAHLESASNERGAIAFATDYQGTGPAPDNRGWRVKEGAKEMVDLSRALLAVCPSIQTVAVLGVSMGGNSTGLAVAAKAKRSDGKPLFDYWVDIEGAANALETYLEASAIASGNAYAAGARDDIAQECGGTPSEKPDCYREITVVSRASDIANSGVKRVVLVHGLDDGLVPYNQSRELNTALRAEGVRTDMYTVLRRNPNGTPEDQGGTTITQNVADPLFGAAGQRYARPLAGHGWEGSSTHIVIKTGFDQLWRLIDGVGIASESREFLVDGEAGTLPVA